MQRYYQLIVLILAFCLAVGFSHARIPRKPWMPSHHSFQTESRADSLTGFDVQKYEITLSIDDQARTIQGNVLATVLAVESLSSISYELNSLTVSSVLVNGAPAAFTHTNGIIQISLNIPAGQTFTTQVFYSGAPQLSDNVYRVGMIFGTNTVFTISDPDAGRQWWPCYDHPWDKAIVDLHITMRSDWLVAANGLRDAIVDNGDGTSTTHWLGQHPMTTYLVCVTAGTYVEIPQTSGTTPIQNFVMPHQYNNALVDFTHVPDMIAYFGDIFGAYPFEKYGHTVVNMSTFGAMEHQTMTTLGNYIITGDGSQELVIAHELAHQWYGNAVSFLTFKDVWLSEGFATYSEHLWTDKRFGWDAACDYVLTSYHQYYKSWENNNGPKVIYDPPFNSYFSPPSYEKAASVLHMLRLKIGNAAFFTLINEWFETYKHGNAITAEFQAMAEQISGMDLQQFFQQWIFGSGIPSIEYSIWNNDASDSPGKIIARSSSPTDTSFDLEIPFRITTASHSDSLVVFATPQGHTNHYSTAISPLSTISPNHNHWTLLRDVTELRPALVECLATNGAVLLSWSAFLDDATLRYNIHRRAQGGDWILINPTPIEDFSYLDTSAQNGIEYEYCLTAVDAGGWETMFSDPHSATAYDFYLYDGLLVVDETKDGNGATANPTDLMVDAFYYHALQPLVYYTWDVEEQGLPGLDNLASYQAVLWHGDDFSDNLLVDHHQVLAGYILGGGKLILSAWRSHSVFPDSFWQRFAGGITPVFNNAASLMAAHSHIYPSLLVDQDKIFSVWNQMLPYVFTFEDAQTPLYIAQMPESNPNSGQCVIFRHDQEHNDGSLVMCGFPLYYMQQNGVRGFLQALISDLDIQTSNDLPPLPQLPASIDVYPNPFNPSATISLYLPQSGTATIELYNIKGQLQKSHTLNHIKAGDHQITLDATDSRGKPLPSGIYLIRLKTASSQIVKRITLLK